jgi:hypothetical protein
VATGDIIIVFDADDIIIGIEHLSPKGLPALSTGSTGSGKPQLP